MRLNTLSIEHGIPSIWAYDLVGAVEPTKIWADFETTSVDHLESLVWSRYAKPEKGFLLAKPGAKQSHLAYTYFAYISFAK